MKVKMKLGVGLFGVLIMSLMTLSVMVSATNYTLTYSIANGTTTYTTPVYKIVSDKDSYFGGVCKFNKGGVFSADSASTAIQNGKNLTYNSVSVFLYDHNNVGYKQAFGATSCSVTGNWLEETKSIDHTISAAGPSGYIDDIRVEGYK